MSTKKYRFVVWSKNGTTFSVIIEAESRTDAERAVKAQYPDARQVNFSCEVK